MKAITFESDTDPDPDSAYRNIFPPRDLKSSMNR